MSSSLSWRLQIFFWLPDSSVRQKTHKVNVLWRIGSYSLVHQFCFFSPCLTCVCVCVCVCVRARRRDVAGQRHAAPLQADGLPGRPAAPHGGSRRQEGGLVMVGCDAQGTINTEALTVAAPHVRVFIIVYYIPTVLLTLCEHTLGT